LNRKIIKDGISHASAFRKDEIEKTRTKQFSAFFLTNSYLAEFFPSSVRGKYISLCAMIGLVGVPVTTIMAAATPSPVKNRKIIKDGISHASAFRKDEIEKALIEHWGVKLSTIADITAASFLGMFLGASIGGRLSEIKKIDDSESG
jgi:MFS family permease